MNKSKISEELKQQVDALSDLARSGATAALGLENSCLVDLPPVLAEVGPDASPSARADVFLRQLRTTIDNRLHGKEKEKAEALFALGDYAGVIRQDRNRRVAKLHDPLSGTWDKFRKEPLTDFAITILTALHREFEVQPLSASEPSTRTPQTRAPLNGGDFALSRYEIFYNFPSAPGEPRESLEVREVRSLRDGMEKWQIGTQYWGKSSESPPQITLFGPGTLDILRDQKHPQSPLPGRAYITRVAFPSPLNKGETIRFGLLRRQAVDFDDLVRDGWCDQRDVTPAVKIDFARIGIRFPTARVPQHIWHFEDIPDYLSPGAPSDSNRLEADGSGYTSYSWDDLLVGHSYGLAWRW